MAYHLRWVTVQGQPGPLLAGQHSGFTFNPVAFWPALSSGLVPGTCSQPAAIAGSKQGQPALSCTPAAFPIFQPQAPGASGFWLSASGPLLSGGFISDHMAGGSTLFSPVFCGYLSAIEDGPRVYFSF